MALYLGVNVVTGADNFFSEVVENRSIQKRISNILYKHPRPFSVEEVINTKHAALL